MTPLTRSRRRAEEFAASLESLAGTGPAPSRGRDAGAAGTEELLRLASVLRQAGAVPLRPDGAFTLDLRERLLAEAATLPTRPTAAPAPRPATRAERRVLAGVTATVVLGATVGMTTAAHAALPGETLYPVKRGLESLSVALSSSDEAKGRELLNQADERLDEVEQLVSSGPAEQDQVPGTLVDFATAARTGGSLMMSSFSSTSDASTIATLHAFTARSLDSLAALADDAPQESQSTLRLMGPLLQNLDDAADSLCPTCASTTAVESSDMLSLGAGVSLTSSLDSSLNGGSGPAQPLLSSPTGTPTAAPDAETHTPPAAGTPTPAPAPAPAARTPTPTPAAGTPTPTPAAGTPTPTPAAGTPTPTPAAGTPTPTPAAGTPTPTPAAGTPTPTPAAGTPTPTPAAGTPTPTPAAGTPTPTPAAGTPPPTPKPATATPAPAAATPAPAAATPAPATATPTPTPATPTPTPTPTDGTPTPTPTPRLAPAAPMPYPNNGLRAGAAHGVTSGGAGSDRSTDHEAGDRNDKDGEGGLESSERTEHGTAATPASTQDDNEATSS